MTYIGSNGGEKQVDTFEDGALRCPICDFGRMRRGEVTHGGPFIRICFSCTECGSLLQLTIESEKGKTYLWWARWGQ